MEVNTRLPLPETILRWWHDVGGAAVTFGSDAHRPDRLAHGFAEAVAMVEAVGFRPARDVVDPWRRA
jgi:histidinol-phosphatase (PHP family)